jgi:hypothetical protein
MGRRPTGGHLNLLEEYDFLGGQASGFGRNQAPKIDRLNQVPSWEFRNSRKSFTPRQLARILWDFTYLCWANPLVECIDPGHPSKDIQGAVMTTKDGRKLPVHLRTFGADQIERARTFGKSIALEPNLERLLQRKAAELYPTDQFFQQVFYKFARNP